MNKQTCILVLGMHRSGTSALTGVLDLLDIYLGSELMEANFANEKGYFENDILYKINEGLLSQINSSWDDVFYNEVKLESLKDAVNLKSVIKSEFEYAGTFAIKDPRIVFLFPVYEKVLSELNVDTKILIPYRNPVEVANSLHKRDGMSLEKGMLLWAYHFLLAEKFSRGYERVFVEFDELIADSQKVINNISLRLSLDLNDNYRRNKKEIDLFLEPSLKHQNITMEDLPENTPNVVKDILSLKGKFDDTDLTKEFDELRGEIFSYQNLFYNNDILNSLSEGIRAKQALQKKSSELRQAIQTLKERNNELGQAKHSLQEKSGELRQTKRCLQEKGDELNTVKQKLNEKENALSKMKLSLSQKEKFINQNKLVVQEKENVISSIKKELTSVYMSKSWKLTRLPRKFMKVMRK